MPTETVDLRCEDNPRRLLGKLLIDSEADRQVVPGNLLEFSCRDCSKDHRQRTGQRVRVLHRFNFVGELIETVEESQDQG